MSRVQRKETMFTQDRTLADKVARLERSLQIALGELPKCRVFNDAAISTPNAGAETALTFNRERWDTDGIHSTSSSRLVCVTPGLYKITGHIGFASNATGTYRLASIRLNGTTEIGRHGRDPSSSIRTWVTVTTEYQLAAGDYVELTVQHDASAAINVDSVGNMSPEFGMVRLGG